MDTVYTAQVDSPMGPVLLAAGNAGIKRIAFARGKPAPQFPKEWKSLPDSAVSTAAGRALRKGCAQLEAYFAGKLRDFDLPLDPEGNAFQQGVWKMLLKIPYGVTWSYGELAERIGRPGAARAVGSANARNPLPIVIPCHRVIGSNGKLTGYYGGVHLKDFLLKLEGAIEDEPVALRAMSPRKALRAAQTALL